MKKIIRTASLLLILSMLICLFAACDKKPNLQKMSEAERADYIIGYIGNDEFGSSYATDMKLEMSGTIMGSDFTVTTSGISTYVGVNTDAESFHEESKMTMTVEVNGTQITQKSERVKGYREGKMYESEKEDGKGFSLVSPITPEDYKEHRDRINDGLTDEQLTEAFKKASEKTCTPLEGGGWSATLSGYDAEALASISGDLLDGLDEMYEGYKVVGFTLTANVTEELMPVDIAYGFSFERTDLDSIHKTPELKMSCTFKDIGTAVLPEVDFSKYTEVEGLADYIEIKRALGKLKSADALEFTSDITQNVSMAGQIQTYTETDIAKAELDKDGKYGFTVRATANKGTSSETVVNLKYADGNMKTSGASVQTQNQAMTDAEAKQYLGTILDPLTFTSAQISEIKLDEGGYTHVFTISDPDYSAYEQLYSQLGASGFKAKAEVAVKYENGVISKMKCNFELTAKIQGQTLTNTVSYTITVENESSNS